MAYILGILRQSPPKIDEFIVLVVSSAFLINQNEMQLRSHYCLASLKMTILSKFKQGDSSLARLAVFLNRYTNAPLTSVAVRFRIQLHILFVGRARAVFIIE